MQDRLAKAFIFTPTRCAVIPAGVALLVINNDKAASQSLDLATPAERYTLTAKRLSDRTVQLNGAELKLGPNDALPELKGTPTKPRAARSGKYYVSSLLDSCKCGWDAITQ
jgi:hypothetical protein